MNDRGETFYKFLKQMMEAVGEKLEQGGDSGCKVTAGQIKGETWTGIHIQKDGDSFAPLFRTDSAYQAYLHGVEIEKLAAELVYEYRKGKAKQSAFNSILEYGKIQGILRTRLVRRENNREFYKEGPYRLHPFGAEVLYVEWEQGAGEIVSTHVTNGIARHWGIPENELFQTALKNI